jgi:Cu-Zn family superoxide dismutase
MRNRVVRRTIVWDFKGDQTMRLIFAATTALALSGIAFTARAEAPKAGETVVALKTSTGEDAGKATFKATKGGVKIELSLKNLPVGEHAVHIHAKPVCDTPDFKGAGGHFNPDAKQHGTLNPAGHHNGDLPQNVMVGTGAPNDILANGGTSIMVHEKPDDMKTDPTGNAGNRIACGVIIGTAAPAK